MKKVVIGIVTVAIIMGIVMGIIWKKSFDQKNNVDDIPKAEEENTDHENKMTRLVANAATKEEAEEIAGFYEIELIEYHKTVAVYETEKEATALIRMGKEKGYPPIAVDYVYSIQ